MAGGFESGDKLVVGDSEKKKAQAAGASVPQERWWLAPEKDLPNAVHNQVTAIIRNDKARLQSYDVFTRLYGGSASPSQQLGNLSAGKAATSATGAAQYQRIAFNLHKACIDTLTSKMAKNKPQPFFLTNKGNHALQKKAQGMNDFVKGVFYQNNAYLRGKRAFRDGCVWGSGIIHTYSAHNRIFFERVFPYELFVDYLEAHYGQESTLTLHRVKNIDRTTLMSLYPKKTKEISQLGLTSEAISGSNRSVSDTVMVIESFRLPSEPGADDGVHCITAQGLVLFVERWDRPRFPFAVFRYSDPLHGFWGNSLSEELMPIQVELNRVLMSIQRSLYMMGTYKILVHNGSKIVDSHFDNRIGTIIKWAGEIAPSYITPPAVQPEIYQQVVSLKAMGYEQSGISALSASSQKPAGLNSGVAMREYHDIEADRFQVVGQNYEDLFIDLAQLSVDEARCIYGESKKLSVQVPGKDFIKTIDWKKVNMEEDQYLLQCFPVSKLPSEPAGRLQTIQELMQGGFIDQAVGRRLLDFPDLSAEETLANAQLDYAHDVLDDIIEGAEYSPPEPDDNLQIMLKLAIEYLAVGKRDNLPAERIQALRNFIKQVSNMMSAGAAAQQQPALPPAGGGAPANPQATPTSDLLPNVNGAAPAA